MLGRLTEVRTVSFQSVWGNGDDWAVGNNSGMAVTQDNVFRINAIFSAVSLISDIISTLPVDVFVRRDGARYPFRPKPAWVEKPDLDLTAPAFWGSIIVSMLLDGNAFIRIFRDRNGEIVNLTVLNPTAIKIERNGLGRVMFVHEGEDKALSPDEVLHIPDLVPPGKIRGVSRVESLKENWGLAMALETYAAKFFGSGASTSGIIEYPGPLTAEQAKDLARAFDNRHSGLGRAMKTAVVSGGAKYNATSVPNDQAQFLDSRRMAVEDVARAFNLPPHKLGLPGTTSYASVEQQNTAVVIDTYTPTISKIEQAFNRLLPATSFLRFNVDGLLRGDFSSRMQGYSIALQQGFISINDVRRLEDLKPIDGGDVIRVPLANIDLPSADLIGEDKKVLMAQKLIDVGFDPTDTLLQLNLPAIKHTGNVTTQLQPPLGA